MGFNSLHGEWVVIIWTSVITGPCWAMAWCEPTCQTPSNHREALTAFPQAFHWRWWASAKAAWSWTRWCMSCRGPAQTRRCLTSLNTSRTCTGWTAVTREAAKPGWQTSRCWRNSRPAACQFTPTWPLTRYETRCGPGWAVSTNASLRPWRSSARVQVRSCTLKMSPPPLRTTSGSFRSFEFELITWTYWGFRLFIKNTDWASHYLHFAVIVGMLGWCFFFFFLLLNALQPSLNDSGAPRRDMGDFLLYSSG